MTADRLRRAYAIGVDEAAQGHSDLWTDHPAIRECFDLTTDTEWRTFYGALHGDTLPSILFEETA